MSDFHPDRSCSASISIAEVARVVASRIRWELENGAQGYLPVAQTTDNRCHSASPVPTPVERAASSGLPRKTNAASATPSPLLRDTRPTSLDRKSTRATPQPSQNIGASADPASSLEALRAAIGSCTRCGLHKNRTHIVFGEGNPRASIAFVGEGPGRDEDEVGRPFVGAAGQLLDRIINAMGLSRDAVYICNIVKCRPPGNRTPEPSEQCICGAFLDRQLTVLRPKVIVALGATAASYLLKTESPVGKLRGRFQTTASGLTVMPTFHPAYLLRNPGAKRDVWHDIQQVMARVNLSKPKGGSR